MIVNSNSHRHHFHNFMQHMQDRHNPAHGFGPFNHHHGGFPPHFGPPPHHHNHQFPYHGSPGYQPYPGIGKCHIIFKMLFTKVKLF